MPRAYASYHGPLPTEVCTSVTMGTTKNTTSHSTPGATSRYGARRVRLGPPGAVQGIAALRSDRVLEEAVVVALLLVGECPEYMQTAAQRLGWVHQIAAGQCGSDLPQLVARALHRREIGGRGNDLRRMIRIVDVVHPRHGQVLPVRRAGHHHVVRVEHGALRRCDPAQVRIVGREPLDVAGPCDG